MEKEVTVEVLRGYYWVLPAVVDVQTEGAGFGLCC